MATLPPDPALARFIKPTVDTSFHIDFDWWKNQGLDLSVQLLSHLSPELREVYAGQQMGDKIDLIDAETGVVQQVAGLQYVIATQCSKDPDYIVNAPTLIEAIFRVFLSNGNQPLSPRLLAPLVGQRAEQILRMVSGKTVRKGIRPIFDV